MTKYNIDDTVWRMSANKPQELRVVGVYVEKHLHPEYTCIGTKFFGPKIYNLFERDLFPTKEELLESL